MPSSILDLVRKADRLPSLPAVAAEVLQLTRMPDVNLDQLAATIQNDPAMTVTILKMVNSPLFGLSRKVTSIKQAVLMLGLRTVKVLVLSFSLVQVMPAKDKFDYPLYWRRSLTMAVAAKLLADAIRLPMAEEAFVAGLLSDIGMIAAWRSAPELYQPVLEEWRSGQLPLIEVEHAQLGVTHPEMTQVLSRTWGLPEPMCEALGAHHDVILLENISEEARGLAKVVYAAAAVAALFCNDIQCQQLDPVKELCKTQIEIGQVELEEVLEKIDSHVREMAQLLSLQLGTTVNYQQLQAEAVAQLTQLSLQAEVERAASTRREEEARQEIYVKNRRMTALESQLTVLEGKAKKADELEHSMRVAGERQRRMLPSKPPVFDGIEIDIMYKPAEQVSGDFYDFVPFVDGRIGFVIGDVSGHGIEAGILMGMGKKILADRFQKHGDPVMALCAANDALGGDLGDSFITACLALYEPQNQNITVVCAGHNPPLLFHPLREPKLTVLTSGGFSLGLARGQRFEQSLKSRSLQLRSGDVFLLYTDGLIEAKNPQDKEFGAQRLVSALYNTVGLPPQSILAFLARDWDRFSTSVSQQDDVTAVCVKFL